LIAGLILSGVFLAICSYWAMSPDRDLYFNREVFSPLSIDTIGKKLDTLPSWHEWHHMAADVRLDGSSVIQSGSTVILGIEPKGRKSRRFEITARVREYVPGKKIALEFVSDSKSKISRLFDRLEWIVEVLPPDQASNPIRSGQFNSLVRGRVVAHTANWRSRVFGRMAPRILLNQVFYPDLTILAGIQQKETSDLLGPSRPTTPEAPPAVHSAME